MRLTYLPKSTSYNFVMCGMPYESSKKDKLTGHFNCTKKNAANASDFHTLTDQLLQRSCEVPGETATSSLHHHYICTK